jgi:hypothetical protein
MLKSTQYWMVFRPGHRLAIRWSRREIIVPDTPAGISARLLKEGEKTLAFFEVLSNEQLECNVYTDGVSWSVRHVLAHFVSAEIGFLELLSDVLTGGSGAPEGFDINAFNQSSVSALHDLPVNELLDQFCELRRQTASKVDQINPELLDRTARHPFLGVTPFVDIIKLIYRHNQIHLRDVRESLRRINNL